VFYCGQCVLICPKKATAFSGNYELATSLERLLKFTFHAKLDETPALKKEPPKEA